MSGNGGVASSANFINVNFMSAYGSDVFISDSGFNQVRKLTCNLKDYFPLTILPSVAPTTAITEIETPTMSYTSANATWNSTTIVTAMPTVAPVTKTPTLNPTTKPSRKPSTKPTLQPTVAPSESGFHGIDIGTTVTLGNITIYGNDDAGGGDLRNRKLAIAGSMLLSALTDTAIIRATAAALDMSEEHITIESEHIVTNITSTVTTVAVELRIIASLVGFADAEDCFEHFSANLIAAIQSGSLQTQILAVAVELGASELFTLSSMNITTIVNSGIVTTTLTTDKNMEVLSDGNFAGVVVGIVVSFAMLLLAMYLCIAIHNSSVKTVSGIGKKETEMVVNAEVAHEV